MATASGQITNAVFGFTSMLINVIKDQQPDGMIVAFDRPEPTFRHEAEPEYKAQREAAPDILRQQMGLVREVLDAVGIQQVEAAGWEADDLLATLTTTLVGRGDDVVIVTGDRDSYQLVKDPHIKVMYNKRGVSDYALYDEAGIEERTGVTPAMYPQYAALRGDNSDNLPGVPGVGEKTAAKLINTYGGLDGIFAHVDEQTPKLRQNLAEHEATGPQEPRADDPPSRRPDRLGRPRLAGDPTEARRAAAPVRLPRVPNAGRPPGRGARPQLGHRLQRCPRGTGRRGRDHRRSRSCRRSDRRAGCARRRRRLGRRAGAQQPARDRARDRSGYVGGVLDSWCVDARRTPSPRRSADTLTSAATTSSR